MPVIVEWKLWKLIQCILAVCLVLNFMGRTCLVVRACVRACMRACVCVRVHMCAMSLSPVAHVAISLPTCNSPLLHPHATMSDHPILWSKLFLASSPGHHTAGVTLAVGIDSQPCLSAATVDVLPVCSSVYQCLPRRQNSVEYMS